MGQQAIRDFLGKFAFDPDRRGWIGIERERFLGEVISMAFLPRAPEFLRHADDSRWTYELSACQVEDRTRPRRDLSHVREELRENDTYGRRIARELSLSLQSIEVASADMPTDIYPDPRYIDIAKKKSDAQILAARRVAGTHIHVGVGSFEEALEVHNSLIPHLPSLCTLGDHSNGERLALYKVMASDWEPREIVSAENFLERAIYGDFWNDPRNCYALIRISVHGTVELRMFGATENVDEILSWAEEVQRIVG